MTDSLCLESLINKILPDEIYNLAAQSHVAVSFQQPEYTANADALGALRILEILKIKKNIKFYQAGTSEMYGKIQKKFQNEKNTILSKKSLRCSKIICTLDNYKLQRGIWYFCK